MRISDWSSDVCSSDLEDGAIRLGIDNDQRDVRRRQRERAVGREADRAGAIEDREPVAQKFEMHEVELGRAASRTRFGTGVTDAAAIVDASLPVHASGSEQKRFREARLARAARPDEGDGPGAN